MRKALTFGSAFTCIPTCLLRPTTLTSLCGCSGLLRLLSCDT